MSGRLEGIARVTVLRGPVEELAQSELTIQAGVAGDARGRKSRRQVTVVFAEDWTAACRDLGAEVPWTLRRANLLVRGVPNPRMAAGVLAIGTARLEINGETAPCDLMDRQRPGLRAALTPDWRGGVTANVIAGGTIRVGDSVEFRPA